MKRSHTLVDQFSDIISASHTDEIESIKNLFKTYDRTKLIKLSEAIQSLLKKDFISELPYEIAMQILSYLSSDGILICSQVSRKWNKLCNDEYLWKNLCIKEKIKCKDSFKANYMMEKTIDCNWRYGPIWAPIVSNAHTKHVITCLEIYQDWIISGSDDSGICIWDIHKGTCIVRLYGHLGGVWSIMILPPLSNDPTRLDYYPLLVSGSTDRTARVWCLDNDKWSCTAVMFGHESTVRCMSSNSGIYSKNDDMTVEESTRENLSVNSKIKNDCLKLHGNGCHCKNAQHFDKLMESNDTGLSCRLICTGSRDASIRIWNAYTGECLAKLKGHRGAVRCIQFVGCHVISGSYDCRIKIWCCRTGECLFTLSNHLNRIYNLWFDGFTIISGSFDTSMKIWNLKQIDNTVSASQPVFSSSSVDSSHEERLLNSQSSSSASSSSDMNMFSMTNGKLCVVGLHTFSGYLSLTSEMIIDNDQLITGNTDKTIRVWRLSNARCENILAGPHQHTSSVTSVQVLKNFIISASNNGIVKLWCRKTGNFIRDIIHLDSADRGGLIWRILATKTTLVCAAGCPLGEEDTKIIIIHFDNGPMTLDKNNEVSCLERMRRLHARNDHRIEQDVRICTIKSKLPLRPGIVDSRSIDNPETPTTFSDESDPDLSWLMDGQSLEKALKIKLTGEDSDTSHLPTTSSISLVTSRHPQNDQDLVFDSEDN